MAALAQSLREVVPLPGLNELSTSSERPGDSEKDHHKGENKQAKK
jgi:hypothetical protein